MDVVHGRRRFDKLISKLKEATGAGDPLAPLRALQDALVEFDDGVFADQLLFRALFEYALGGVMRAWPHGDADLLVDLGALDATPSREGWRDALQRVIDRLEGTTAVRTDAAADGVPGLHDSGADRPAQAGEPPQRCRQIVDAVAARFHEPHLQLGDIAADTRLSPWHVTRLLKRHTGRGFATYLRDLRIAEAQRLLGNRTLSAKEIAAAAGFSSASHFTRQFKQACGVTPVAFRDRAADRSTAAAPRKNRQAIATSGKT